MKYKVGDKVKLKSKEGLYEIERQLKGMAFNPEVYDFAGAECTICNIVDGGYIFDISPWVWSENTIEGLVEEQEQINKRMETFYFVRQPDHMIECSDNFTGGEDVSVIKHTHKIFKTKEEALAYQRELGIGTEADRKCLNKWFAEEGMAEVYGYIKRPSLSIKQMAPDMQLLAEAYAQANVVATGVVLPKGYQFKDENGNVINTTKIVLEKKKKEYPKTLGECRTILGIMSEYGAFNYKANLITTFMSLLICRDAYWKIAGEEMGLGKPWEPDWANLEQNKHCIWVDVGDIILNEGHRYQHILSFPTAEMRNAFYENFKSEIEICKEFL